MNKRQLHHFWTKIRWLKPWYFLAACLVLSVVCVIALRANNEHMIKLRSAVYAADKQGSDVETPLKALQAYVTTHMNTDLNTGQTTVYPPIQLKYTYDRLVQAKASQANESNTQIYTDAQHYCEQQNSVDFSGHNRVPCIEQYVTSHSQAQAQSIPDSLYKFSFVSPKWSPDLAGWTMLLAVISGVLFVVTFAFDQLSRH